MLNITHRHITMPFINAVKAGEHSGNTQQTLYETKIAILPITRQQVDVFTGCRCGKDDLLKFSEHQNGDFKVWQRLLV